MSDRKCLDAWWLMYSLWLCSRVESLEQEVALLEDLAYCCLVKQPAVAMEAIGDAELVVVVVVVVGEEETAVVVLVALVVTENPHL